MADTHYPENAAVFLRVAADEERDHGPPVSPFSLRFRRPRENGLAASGKTRKSVVVKARVASTANGVSRVVGDGGF
jgi:hypothetical protein